MLFEPFKLKNTTINRYKTIKTCKNSGIRKSQNKVKRIKNLALEDQSSWYQMMEELLGALASCASFNGSSSWWNLEASNRRSGWNFSWCGSHGNVRKEVCKEVDGEVDGESLEGGWANLQERKLLASKRRNSMWNLRQCVENLAAYHYSKSSLQWRFLNLLLASSFSSKLR